MNKSTVYGLLTALIFLIALPAQALEKETESFIQDEIEKRWLEFMDTDEFQQRIDDGILRFIDEQNKRQAQAERDSQQRGTQQLLPVDSSRDHIRGDVNAEFTLLEYSDFECPFCKRFHDTANKFIERNRDVNWVYRHFPLSSHNPGAQLQAEGAECVAELAGNDAFWDFTDLIYKKTRSGGRGFPVSNLASSAESLGINPVEFQQCLDSTRHRKRVMEDLANGQLSGVTGTPGNFLIHNPSGTLVVITGAQPLENLESTLKALKQQFANN